MALEKSIRELLAIDGYIRVIGITTSGEAEQIMTRDVWEVKLTYYPDWEAWSTRVSWRGCQQICVFRKVLSDDELRDIPESEAIDTSDYHDTDSGRWIND